MNNELERIKQRDGLVTGFMNRELTSKDDRSVESSSKLNAVRELLTFHEEHSSESDKLLIQTKKNLENLMKEVEEANSALVVLRMNENSKISEYSRDVSIIFSAPSEEEVILKLT